MRKLRRSPGVPYQIGFAPVVYDSTRIADVNGYYETLGLVGSDGRVRRSISQSDIVTAYRRRFAQCHPDSGGWDYEAWERVECAKECLADPRKKVLYDQLRPPRKWRDRVIDRELAELGVDLSKLAEEPTTEETRYCYYYLEGVPPPPYDQVLRWLREVSYAYYLRRMPGPVRIGFTDGSAGVLRRPWGQILMVPAQAQPEPWQIQEWLDSQLRIPAPCASL